MVRPSLSLTPESVANANVGATAVASSVKSSGLESALTLPAASVCLTRTDFGPSSLSMTLVSKPAIQLPPPSVLYSQLASGSRSETVTVPSLVRPSLSLTPESVKASVGAAAAVASSMKSNWVDSTLTLPAASVCLTRTDFRPSSLSMTLVSKPAIQLPPPSVLYSQLASGSRSETVTVPSLVRPSLSLTPESVTRASVGVATSVST